jgi:hypothetical protein
MICEQKENNIQTSGIKLTKEMGINHEGMGFIQNILRSQIYSDKISSLIREIAVNAIDSHVEAGCPERPIEVTLPSRWETTFKIRDFGTGMSEETILNLYAYFGSSTKRNTNLQSGFMGIGKVAPLSYGDSFILTSFLDGVKNTYNVYVDSENLSQIAKLASEPTVEENGIEILVAVKDYDVQAFHDKAFNLFRYFKIRPITHGASFEYENKTPLMKGSDWAIYANGGQSAAVMGNISYPIQDHFDDSNITNALSCGLEIHFGIGEISCQASREGLEYTPKTKKAIKDKLTRVVAEVSAELNSQFKNCATLFDAHKLYSTIMDYGSNLYVLRGMVKSSLQFNGQPVTSARLSFSEPTNGEFSIRQYEKTYRGNKVKSWVQNNVECSDATVLIDNDLNISAGITNRVWNLVQHGKKVYVLSYRTPADRDAFIADSGLDASNFILLSSLPKISLATATGASPKNAKHSSKEFIFDLNYASTAKNWHRKNSDYWAKEIVDAANDSGVYVILDEFKYQAKDGSFDAPSELNSIITALTTFGITVPKIFGFKEAKRAAVEANTNMVSLWTFMETELTNYFASNNIAQKLADRLEFDRNENQNWLSSAPKITKDVDAKSVFAKIATAFESMKHTKSKTILDEAIKWKAYYPTTEKPQQDLAALAEEMNTTYPLFPHIRYWESDNEFRQSIVQYINLLG